MIWRNEYIYIYIYSKGCVSSNDWQLQTSVGIVNHLLRNVIPCENENLALLTFRIMGTYRCLCWSWLLSKHVCIIICRPQDSRLHNVMEAYFPSNSASYNCNEVYSIRFIISHAALIQQRHSTVSCSPVSNLMKGEYYVHMSCQFTVQDKHTRHCGRFTA